MSIVTGLLSTLCSSIREPIAVLHLIGMQTYLNYTVCDVIQTMVIPKNRDGKSDGISELIKGEQVAVPTASTRKGGIQAQSGQRKKVSTKTFLAFTDAVSHVFALSLSLIR